MARTANILCGCTVLECQYSLGNHLTSVGADNVDSEDSVCFLICNESVKKERIRLAPLSPAFQGSGLRKYILYHALSIEVGLSSRVCAERETPNIVALLCRLDLLLRQANPCGLRVCVHNAGNSTIVYMAISLADVLNGRDTFLLGLVRQHGTKGDIADHTDMGDLSAVFLVDDDTAAFVSLNANIFKTEASGIGAAADRDEDNVGVKLNRWILV